MSNQRFIHILPWSLWLVLFLGLTAPCQLFSQEPAAELSLPQAISLALDGSPGLKASRFAADAAIQQLQMVRSNYWPKLSYDLNLTRGNNPVYVFGSLLTQRRFTAANFSLPSLNNPAPLNNFQNKFSASMLLYDFGRTHYMAGQTGAARDQAKAEVKKDEMQLIYRVTSAYYDALLMQEMVRVAEDSVKSAEADAERARSMFTNGMTVESDLLSVNVHRAAQLEELVRARNQLKLAYSRLNFEMGLALDRPFNLKPVEHSAAPELPDLAACQSAALEKRPEYQQALLGRQQGDLAAKSARSEFLPVLSAMASWETDDDEFGANGNNWVAGINLHFNLFNGRADKARLAASQLEAKRSSALAEQQAAAIRLQVQQAWLDLDTALRQTEVTQQAVSQAEESLRIIKNRYESGLATVTDLLRAETMLTSTRANNLRAQLEQRTSAANLELQSGRLDRTSPLLQE